MIPNWLLLFTKNPIEIKTIVNGSIFNGGPKDSKSLSSTLLPVF